MAGIEKGDSNEVDSTAAKECVNVCDTSTATDSKNPVHANSTETTKESVETSLSVMEVDPGDASTSTEISVKEAAVVASNPVQKPTKVAENKSSTSNVERVDFKVIYNKTKYDINFALDETVEHLKFHLHDITGVPNEMQKLMIRGLAKDSQTLREAGISRGSKVMLVGSKIDDLLSVSKPTKQELEEKITNAKEAFCKQKMHRKVLDKGVPDDVMPGILNTREALPPYPLSGMLNKYGGKVRLTFKLEMDQVWIGTKERTQKLSMNSIRGVVSEPIEGHEQYHILGIQLGPTEASRYWVYWVPVQYIDAIKDTIMGAWSM